MKSRCSPGSFCPDAHQKEMVAKCNLALGADRSRERKHETPKIRGCGPVRSKTRIPNPNTLHPCKADPYSFLGWSEGGNLYRFPTSSLPVHVCMHGRVYACMCMCICVRLNE